MKKQIFISLTSILLMYFQSCEYNDLAPPLLPVEHETNESLIEEIEATGFTYFRQGEVLHGGPHGSFKLRFNEIAWSALDNTGELPAGNSFPFGSVAVKEAFSGDTLKFIAAMKKIPSDSNAGEGWVWLEYTLDKSFIYGIEKKGTGCVNCHSIKPNRDLVRTFDLH